jgi:hypothetical protein
MADIDITQAEAEKLMAMKKRVVNRREWMFPAPPNASCAAYVSRQARKFYARRDVDQIKLAKATFQNRARGTIILYRLDY